MPVFALATLAPAGLIAAACLWGGAWAAAALLAMTLLAAGLDLLVARVAPAAEGQEFPAADALAVALALAHFALLPLAAWAVAGGSGLDPGSRLAAGLAAGLWLGQVSHPNAHELIHRPQRLLFQLGRLVYVTLLIGHHTSAHRLVHHRHVGLPEDPATARRGESFYRYLRRAWTGSFRAGLLAERRLGRTGLRSPYLLYCAGALAALALGWALAGPAGALAWAALAGFAQSQLFLSDYVQHYGLTRPRGPDGRPLPVAGGESWNAPHWYTGHMMLNAPRHSDHHAHPSRPFPALRLEPAQPTLPHALPVMAVIALAPPLFRRVMARELDRQVPAPAR